MSPLQTWGTTKPLRFSAKVCLRVKWNPPHPWILPENLLPIPVSADGKNRKCGFLWHQQEKARFKRAQKEKPAAPNVELAFGTLLSVAEKDKLLVLLFSSHAKNRKRKHKPRLTLQVLNRGVIFQHQLHVKPRRVFAVQNNINPVFLMGSFGRIKGSLLQSDLHVSSRSDESV